MRAGIALANPGKLTYVQEYNLIMRADAPRADKVSIVQGSGSGHEPAYVNEYCTSLDMAGASLTLVKLDDEIDGLLGAPPRSRSASSDTYRCRRPSRWSTTPCECGLLLTGRNGG